MILHVAAFVWKDDVTADDVAGATEALRAMAAQIPELRFYECGESLRLRPNGADFAVAAVVDDEAGLAAYLDSEAHAAVYAAYLGRMIESRLAAQLHLEGGVTW